MKAGEVVREIYETRKRRNPTYSLRAFARDSGVGVTLLSRVFQAKSPFTFKQAIRMKGKIRLTAAENGRLLGAFDRDFAPKPARTTGAPSRYADPGFKRIAEGPFDLDWRDIALLNLTLLDDFRDDVVRIGARLGIRPSEAADAIERLVKRRLLVDRNGGLKKRHAKMLFDSGVSMEGIRRFHRQMITKALMELDRTGEERVDRRLINGYTIAVDAKRIPEAKRRIEAFQQEMTEFLSGGTKTEVYQMNVQLFPLTVSAPATRKKRN